jgi:hypothetical protein
MRPKNFQLYLKYVCDCGSTHWVTLDEAKGGYILVCDECKKLHKIEKIAEAKVLINFCKTEYKKVANPSNPVVKKAHEILRQYGYDQSTIEQVNREVQAKSSDVLVKEFLSRQV